jgi:small subunit ribosomal protein S9
MAETKKKIAKTKIEKPATQKKAVAASKPKKTGAVKPVSRRSRKDKKAAPPRLDEAKRPARRSPDKAEKYIRALGRRKEATAITKLWQSKKGIVINGRNLSDYFTLLELQKIVEEPLKITDLLGKVGIEITAKGGGTRGQAEACRLAIARALVKNNSDLKKGLKIRGLLTRDSRVKERKKFGLKKARRAPQWRKR